MRDGRVMPVGGGWAGGVVALHQHDDRPFYCSRCFKLAVAIFIFAMFIGLGITLSVALNDDDADRTSTDPDP